MTRMTGLTARALRFYEARGLLRPVRDGAGRRQYGAAQLEALHRIMAMKRAGLTLSQIQSMTAGPSLDLHSIVTAQIQVLTARERELAVARELLASILSRIERSEPIDVATFCSLIRQGENAMSQVKLDALASQYMSHKQKHAFQEAVQALPADFDAEAHDKKWQALSARIKAALPLDPASPAAQAFLDEWNELAAPYIAVCSAEALEGVSNMHEHIE
ncbi:MAG: MerR family transcriptional regulator, partial [Gammaproteobacteria bacterium]